MTKELLNYFAGDELAASTWENKYALRDDMGELLEQSPEEMHHRLAREFWRVEKDFIDKAIIDGDKLSEYGQKRKDLNEETIFKLFDKFKYIVPAGSVMAGAGGGKPVSLSNCFVLPTMPKDSYSSIMFSRQEMVQLEKRRGGTGVDLSNLRPRGAFVNNAAKTSTGAASFMEGFSAINNEVAQCIEENQEVLTKKGLTKIKDINIGDEVYTRKGFIKVIGKFDKGIRDTIILKTKQGTELKATSDHVIMSADNTIGPINKKISELRVGDSVGILLGENIITEYQTLTHSYQKPLSRTLKSGEKIPHNRYEDITIPTVLNEKLAYLVGYAHGDGYTGETGTISNLSITCCSNDTDILDKLVDYKNSIFKNAVHLHNGCGNCKILSICATEGCEFLKENGLNKPKTAYLRVPLKIWNSPSSVQMAYFSGLFDADGYASGRKKGYSLCTINKEFAGDIRKLLLLNGIYSKIYTEIPKNPRWSTKYYINVIGKYNQEQLLAKTTECIKIQNKKFIAKRDNVLSPFIIGNEGIKKQSHIQYKTLLSCASLNRAGYQDGMIALDYVTEISSGGKNHVYDIELESENMFWCEGVYVHNCGRRGALMITISIVHPDSPEFITVKQNLTKVTGANISVKIPDDFMKAVEKNEDYLLHWPVRGDHVPIKEVEMEYNILYPSQYTTPDGKTERGYIKKIHAKELWDTLIHCAWNTAEPGILFESTLHGYAPDGVYPKFKMISTNPCQPLWATVISKNKGLTTLGEVGIGEEIWSSEGWTRIVNKQYTGKKDVYSIRTSGGVFYGTENHRVVSDGKKIEAGLCDSIDSLSGEVFNRESPIDPTVVMDGLVLGDGEVHKASNNLVLLDIGKDDYDYFKSDVASLIGKHRPGIHEYSYEVITNIRPEELISKTAIEIPERYMSEEKDRICDFLRGLYSANGSVVNNRITLKTASPKLRDQVQLLLSYLGIDSYYTTNKEKSVEFSNGTYTCNESYDINISTDRDKFVANIGFIQEYKNNKIDLNLSRPNRSKERLVVCKEYISTEDVFDITVNNSSHTYWTGGLNVSNCGEIPMGSGDSCRLIHVNLSSFVKNSYLPGAEVDWDKLYSVFYEATRLGDDLVTLEEEAVDRILNIVKTDDPEYAVWDKIKKTAREGRRSGVGFFGLSDMIAMLGIKFCSPESIEIVDKVCHKMMEAELDAEVDLAIERGMFPTWNKTYETADANRWYKFVSSEYPEQWKRMQEHGRRNISFSTVAPTGTTSLISRASSGIEPVFMPFYMRRRKCNSDSERVDFVDKMGVRFQEFIVVHPGLEEWAKITYPGENIKDWKLDKWQEVFEKSPWYGSTSPEIDWEKRVELQGVVQKYITHAISSTVNLPNNVTEDEVSKIYMTAWKTGNKGQTIYREGSRDGILVRAEEKRRDDKFRSYVEAPKRPKVLPADFYTTKVKGELFYVMVGLYLDKPYEIFVFKPDLGENEKSPKQHRGEITKIKRGVYTFKSDLLTIENISKDLSPIEYTVVLFSSMLLRTGANIKYVIKTAQKAKDGINGFTSALVRILSKYSPDELLKGETCPECGGTLVRESGCIMCKDCGYSKCL